MIPFFLSFISHHLGSVLTSCISNLDNERWLLVEHSLQARKHIASFGTPILIVMDLKHKQWSVLTLFIFLSVSYCTILVIVLKTEKWSVMEMSITLCII